MQVRDVPRPRFSPTAASYFSFQFLSPPQLFVKTLTGRKCQLDMEPTTTIIQIKESLQEKEGIDAKQIRLIHNGKQLADSETIESSKIEPGVTIHMVLSLRGGSS